MTFAVTDDFGEFVTARWRDLEAVALLATLDREAARATTCAALAALWGRWNEVRAEASPTSTARVELVRRLGRQQTGEVGVGSRPIALAGEPPPSVTQPGSGVPAALLRHLAHEDTEARILLAAEVVWGLFPDEVAAVRGMPTAQVRSTLTGVRERLLDAHRAARAVDGLAPLDAALDAELADLAEALLSDGADVPDPSALVGPRARALRRRDLLLGGSAVAGTVVAGWVALGGGSGGVEHATAPTRPAPTPPDSNGWWLTRRWPARGGLATSADIQRLVATDGPPGSRLLWADDVGATRVAIAAVLNPTVIEGTRVRLWVGRATDGDASLRHVGLDPDHIDGVRDVVAVAAPSADGWVLVVLARPDVDSAETSRFATPGPDGLMHRSWSGLRLDLGVAGVRLGGSPPVATRVRCGQFDGAPLGCLDPWTTAWGPVGDVTTCASAVVAAVTGVPPGHIRSEVVVDTPVDIMALDSPHTPSGRRTGRAVVVHAHTPRGGLARLVFSVDGSSQPPRLRWATVITALEAHQPLMEPIQGRGPPRFLVVAPGASEVQLLSPAPSGDPVSAVTPTTGDAAVVVIDHRAAGMWYRLVTWDAHGRRTDIGVSPRSRSLLDLT